MTRFNNTLCPSAAVILTSVVVLMTTGCGTSESTNRPPAPVQNQPAAVEAVAPQTGYADVNGLRMYYEIHGTGKPVVVLHGAFGWATAFPALARNRQVIAVEFQGHGHTADIDRPLAFVQLADDTAALLKHLKLEKVDIFGYSIGGNVALAMAIRHPTLVNRVAIYGSNAGPIQESYEPASFQQIQSLSAEFAPRMLKDHYDSVAPDPEKWPALVAKIRAMGMEFPGFTREELQSIKAPVLISLGDRDVVRPEHSVEMYRQIPVAQLAIFPGGDHFLIFQNPDKLLRSVGEFFDAPMIIARDPAALSR